MPKSKYSVQFRLAGGALVTQTILAAHEGDAAARIVKKFKATEVLKIRKVKQ